MSRFALLVAVVLCARCASSPPGAPDIEVPHEDPHARLDSTDPMRVVPRDRFMAMMRAQQPQCADACFTASLEAREPLHQHELADVERAVAECCASGVSP